MLDTTHQLVIVDFRPPGLRALPVLRYPTGSSWHSLLEKLEALGQKCQLFSIWWCSILISHSNNQLWKFCASYLHSSTSTLIPMTLSNHCRLQIAATFFCSKHLPVAIHQTCIQSKLIHGCHWDQDDRLSPPASQWSCCPWVRRRWPTFRTTVAHVVFLSVMPPQPRFAGSWLTAFQSWIWMRSIQRVRCGSLQSVYTSASKSAASTPCLTTPCNHHAGNTDASILFVQSTPCCISNYNYYCLCVRTPQSLSRERAWVQ